MGNNVLTQEEKEERTAKVARYRELREQGVSRDVATAQLGIHPSKLHAMLYAGKKDQYRKASEARKAQTTEVNFVQLPFEVKAPAVKKPEPTDDKVIILIGSAKDLLPKVLGGMSWNR